MEQPPATPVNSYDAVPYKGMPIRQTHPGWLSSLAQLLSIQAPSPHRCRVLELGCCDGGNLIAMAMTLPDATFVGVDLSTVQIDAGLALINQLGVKNVELRCQSILDITADIGKFDYILCHGVFSWVPTEIQEQILEISSRLLSPRGIAYISYNAKPGWHFRGIVRDMMRYHALRFDEPVRRIQEARLILDFISEHASRADSNAYSTFLKSEAETLRKAPDHYLYHEHLEDHSEPFYFHEFVDRARAHGLDFLADASLGSMSPVNFGPAADGTLTTLATNLIELEQFMDFLRNRTFRETLLVHAGGPTANYTIEPSRLKDLHITGTLRPQQRVVDLRPEKPVTFESHKKYPITTSDPLTKAALLCLVNEFPSSISLESLAERARAQLRTLNITGSDPQQDVNRLGAAALRLLTTSDLLEVSTLAGNFKITPDPKPRASPLARLQAESSTLVVNYRLDVVPLQESECAVLARLDGTQSAAEIATSLSKTEQEITQTIDRLARCALLT